MKTMYTCKCGDQVELIIYDSHHTNEIIGVSANGLCDQCPLDESSKLVDLARKLLNDQTL